MNKSKIKNFKKIKSKLLLNLNVVMPMIEELTASDMLPICVIGMNIDDAKTGGKVKSQFSTLSNAHDETVYEVCKALVEAHKHKYEKDGN